MHRSGFAGCLLLAFAGNFLAQAQDPERLTFGKVVGVYRDGRVGVRSGKDLHTYPLFGIALPKPDQPGHIESFQVLSKLLNQQGVHYAIVELGKEKFLRVRVGENWANLALIEAGAAWHDPKQIASATLAAAQAKAQKNKLGLWAMAKPVAPWDWVEKRAADDAKAVAERNKAWDDVRVTIPAAEREEAAALLKKAMDAMGGEDKLAQLQRGCCSLEVTISKRVLGTDIWPLLGTTPVEGEASKWTFNFWWDGKENARMEVAGRPELKVLLDPKLHVRLNGYLLPDKVVIAHQLRNEVGDKRFDFRLSETLFPEVKAKETITELQEIVLLLQSGLQVYPCLGPRYLLRMAAPREGDARPAILVASRYVSVNRDASDIVWTRICFHREKGQIEELSTDRDPTQLIKLSDYREIGGLTYWTKAELSNDSGRIDITARLLDLKPLAAPIAELAEPKIRPLDDFRKFFNGPELPKK